MHSKRRHAWVGFALSAGTGILGVFVLAGAAAAVVCFAAMLVFIGACIYALRGENPADVERNTRAGFAGWWWFF